MKKSSLTRDEILAAEEAAENRRRSRAKGFDLMKTRDSGHGLIRDYGGKVQEIWMLWGYDGKFKLDIRLYGGKNLELVLDGEEVRKWLRWV